MLWSWMYVIRGMMIAAHARSRRDILITNNVREFSRVDGLAAEDWKTAAS